MKTRLLLGLLLTGTTTFYGEIAHTYRYTTPLCLNLVKGEFLSFIHNAISQPKAEWEKALNDAIALRAWNRIEPSSPSIETMLQELSHCLKQRIDKIEDQIEKKHWLDYEALLGGTAVVAAGIGIGVLTYYFYKNGYQKNNSEYATIKNKLEGEGVEVNLQSFRDVIEIKHPGYPYKYDYKKGDRLVELANNNRHSGPLLFFGAIASPVVVWWGAAMLRESLSPDADNGNLGTYKELLHCVEQLKKST